MCTILDYFVLPSYFLCKLLSINIAMLYLNFIKQNLVKYQSIFIKLFPCMQAEKLQILSLSQ